MDKLPFLIADIGGNHNQDMYRCDKLIRAAKRIGCDAVKIQVFEAARLYDETAPQALIDEVTRREFPIGRLPDMRDLCKEHDIQLYATPTHPLHVPLLEPFVDGFKIGSYEVLCTELIDACYKTGKLKGIALGNASGQEMGRVIDYVNGMPPGFDTPIFYHCCSEYPAPLGAVDLEFLDHWIMGYSDHTAIPISLLYAAVRGMTHIEFHLDLCDLAGYESVHGHCYTEAKALHAVHMMQNWITIDGADRASMFARRKALGLYSKRTDPITFRRRV